MLGAILLLAFALRTWDAANLRMWGDEGYSVYSASRSLYAMTFEGIDVDPHPPLYYYLLHFYLPIAGTSELAIRFFSIFFGTATVALAFATGKRMFDARVGALAAALIAVAPFAVHYSQEVRMYALVMFLAALALYLFARLWQEDAGTQTAPRVDKRGFFVFSALVRARPRPIWIFYALTLLAMQYTLYQAAFVFLALGIFLLPFFFTRRAFVIRWFAVAIGVVILFLPWLAFRYHSAFTDIQDVAGTTVPMDVFTFLARGFAGLTVGPTLPVANALPLAALFALVIVAGVGSALATRAAKLADGLLVSLVVVPMLALYPVYYVLPLYRGRLFALALLPLMLLTARGFRLLAQRARWFSALVALGFIAAIALGLNQYYFRYSRYSATVDDYIPAIHAIESVAQPGDVILFHAYWQEGYFLSHYHGAPIALDSLENRNALQAAVAQPRNVWAIVQALDHHGAEDGLAQNAFIIGEKKYGQMRVIQYRAGTPAVGADFASPVVFDNGMTLLGYHINGDAPIDAGRGALTLQLDWQAAQNMARDYTVSVRVTNNDNAMVWAQNDTPSGLPTSTWQAGQNVIDRHAFVIPAGTPPGTYRVRVVIYDSASGRAANIVAPENLRGQAVLTGAVMVSKSVATIARLTPLTPLNAHWNEIALDGFDARADELWAGDALPLTLYWRADQKPGQDYVAEIKMIDSSGSVRAAAQFKPANGFPARAWWTNDTLLDKLALTIAADAAPGDAKILVGLNDAAGKPIAPGAVEIARVKINARPHRFALPAPQFAQPAMLGDAIQLLGFDLDTNAIKPGTTIPLTLYWQARDKTSERYTVFVHLLDARGNIIAQRDREPDAGNAPTTSWVKEEIITDHVEIELPVNRAPGEYLLVVGMYQPASGKRLRVNETGTDSIPLTKIKISAP